MIIPPLSHSCFPMIVHDHPIIIHEKSMTNIHCYPIYKSIIVHDNLFIIIPSLSHYHDHPPYDNDE